MMHQKALLFADYATASKIMESSTPKEQKALGRKVKNFGEDMWIANRLRIVVEGSYLKFAHSLLEEEDLTALLLATGDRELVEVSPFDRIWGIGFGEVDAENERARWGLNLLGKALTEARTRIRDEAATERGREDESDAKMKST